MEWKRPEITDSDAKTPHTDTCYRPEVRFPHAESQTVAEQEWETSVPSIGERTLNGRSTRTETRPCNRRMRAGNERCGRYQLARNTKE